MVWYTKILDFFLCWAIFAFLRYCHSPLPVPESLSPVVKNLHSWELLGYQWHWIIFHVMQMPHNIYQCVAGLGWKERRHLCLWAQLLKCRTPQSLSKHQSLRKLYPRKHFNCTGNSTLPSCFSSSHPYLCRNATGKPIWYISCFCAYWLESLNLPHFACCLKVTYAFISTSVVGLLSPSHFGDHGNICSKVNKHFNEVWFCLPF